jgi:hypothetical protein
LNFLFRGLLVHMSITKGEMSRYNVTGYSPSYYYH